MDYNKFEKEKQAYENIEIPKELDFKVRQSLKLAKKKKKNKIIIKSVD